MRRRPLALTECCIAGGQSPAPGLILLIKKDLPK
jgi:hypothetical protein